MGTCYYLIRRDNRTGYDLGKSYGWDKAFGNGDPITLGPSDTGVMVELLTTITIEHWGWTIGEALPYLTLVVDDIIDWSEGRPFEYHIEHSGIVEDLAMEGWDEGWDSNPPTEREWITGDRHTPHMIKCRDKRHSKRVMSGT